MKNIEDISEKVEKRKRQLESLFKKDEENYDLWAGKEQIFDTHKMSINITGTEMVALATKMQASIVRSKLDIHVLPPDPLPNDEAEKTANHEEDMYYFGFNQADERLFRIGEASLLSSAAWQGVVLGRIAVRVCIYKDGKDIVWDYLPLNPRFLTFNFDSKGLAWACYETFRSSDSIEEEYGKEVTEDDQGKGISVSDYWDRKDNVRYLTKSKELLKSDDHPYGEVPIILQPINLGPKAITSEGVNVTAWGQSIFDPVKIPFRNLNKMRSIAATQAHLLAKAPLDVPYSGDKPNLEAEHFDYYPGAVLEHPNTYTIAPLKIVDIPQSLMAMMGDISAGIEKATYAELNPDKPAHSGSALRILGQDKRDVETPRVGGMNTMYTRICRMVKKQIIALKLTIPVRTVVNEKYEIYDMKPKLLDNDFYVNAELLRKDVYDEVEALQRAQMFLQLRLKSRKKIMEQVLGEQDVPTQMAEMDIEDVEAGIPELVLKRVIKTYMDRGMEEEANMAKEQLFLLEEEKRQSVIPPEMMGAPPAGVQPGQPPMPGTPR